uniref:sensor histidine kinase n=1 Tax=Micromonospora polyrhachis TaxID=1282883 RepID=UPI0035E46041
MSAGLDPASDAKSSQRRRRLDVRVVPHRRRSPLRLRDWRMRTKLGAVLILPSVAFLVLAGVQTNVLIGRTNVLGDFAEQVEMGRPITALVHELQQERARTAGELAGLRFALPGRVDSGAAVAALDPLYHRTDEAITRFRNAGSPLLGSDVSWRVAYSRADEALNLLADVRAAVPAVMLSTETVLGNYSRAIEALLSLLAEPSPGSDQPELTEAVLRYVQLARVKEVGARIRAQLYGAGRARAYGPEDQMILADLRAQQLAALAEFRVVATTGQIQRYDEIAVDPGFLSALRMEGSTIPSDIDDPAVLEPGAWWAASEQRSALLRQVEVAVLTDAVTLADSRSVAQLRRTLLVAGGVLAVLAGALLISIIIGRSVARSLRMLRTQALRVAQVELPEALDRLRQVHAGVSEIEVPPADVRAMDEIGEVAEAFVAVHRSAVTVAVEQAVMRRNVNAMFVNLARRSQVLVERQLELLDDLEREEDDPDQLDSLFKIDHLAARMRRNDESLLVLAGSEPTRRRGRPVPLSTVMLAATAEIEQYQRIRPATTGRLHIVGHAVPDLVHLLAELLENATSFSPPDTVVRIAGHPHGRDEAVIEIVDEGLGMSPTAIEAANQTLASPPAADVSASERMGLFVVSHLAARQNIRVRLGAAGRGVTAAVWLPTTLLAPADQREPEHQPPRRVLAALAGPTGAVPVGVSSARQMPPGVSSARQMPTRIVPASGVPAAIPTGQPVTPTGPTVSSARAAGTTVAGATPAPASAWWSRQGARPAAPAPVPKPAAPRTGGVNARGLPVRVPMAQLPGANPAEAPPTPARRHEPDPEAVGGMLTRFYGGVRRAEAEETTEIVLPPSGTRTEREQQ